ncbi:hypothetical protein DFP72DRAFT_1052706 [Ephemerocybe angulata]|uniref:Uncharacterized protein n=1 Tax=Ephemerocybe angulata TaxID=980116 RepID=A0A8H6HCH3_9AGAR|nr:hypothetical protein DFP72DRAFT_1052706 [Tulosesus angulatus]
MSPRTPLQLVLLFLLSLQLSFVIAKPTFPQHGVVRRAPTSTTGYETNAKRLAAGLPPLTPLRRFTPTRVGVAARAPSPILYSGSGLRINDWATNAPIGWVSRTTSTGRIRMTTTPGDALPVTFSFVSSDTTLELAINDSLNWHYLGAQGNALSGPSSTTVNGFVRTNSVSCGSAAAVVGHSAGSGATESCIWKFNPSTSEFTSVWTNPDLAVLDTYFYISNGPGLRFLYLTSNPNLPVASGVTRVRLYLDTA